MRKLIIPVVVVAGIGVAAIHYLHGVNIAVLNPKGPIAAQERSLIIAAFLLMLVVVIPVFALTFGIAWKYRAGNARATYTPDWDHNPKVEFIWWGIPFVLILILSVMTWQSSHQLDPFKPLNSSVKPLTIQVVALDWKWLFIYPQQQIATVNLVRFPAATPIHFEITSDAPMNSFWIPQLGGQIYAMPGMSTQLQLMADGNGTYAGSSSNISGAGFAGMRFSAQSTSQADFDQWVQLVRHASSQLTPAAYTTLAQPSQNDPVAYYGSATPGLYDSVIMKYMMPMPPLGTQ